VAVDQQEDKHEKLGKDGVCFDAPKEWLAEEALPSEYQSSNAIMMRF